MLLLGAICIMLFLAVLSLIRIIEAQNKYEEDTAKNFTIAAVLCLTAAFIFVYVGLTRWLSA